MQAPDESASEDTNLARLLERRINELAQGRIVGVRVELGAERLIVHGHAKTHYAKQLALQAIREVGTCPVELNVKVGPTKP